MFDLKHYNLLSDFSLREAAYLAAGIDPAAVPYHAMANTIQQQMERALDLVFARNRVRSNLVASIPPEDTLLPIALDTTHPDTLNIPTPGEVMRVQAKYQTAPDSVRFERKRLARWFASHGRGFVPIYVFDTSELPLALPTVAGSSPPSDRERATYLNIIAAMLELLLSPRAGRDTQAAVIDELIENYGEKQGIAKSTLEAKFAEAKRRLREG